MRPAFFRLTAVAVLVGALYGLPLLLAGIRQGRLLNIAYDYDAYYGLRVADAARGRSLGNPYLVEHQNAPRHLPELAERSLGIASRISGVSPLVVLAVSRVFFAVAIFLLLESLARGLGIEPRAALLAAALAPLSPSLTQILQLGFVDDAPSFLRYFRTVSPGPHVALFLGAMCAVLAAFKTPSWLRAILAGLLLGLLFYTTVYYYSVAIAGVVVLIFIAEYRARRILLVALFVATVMAVPYLLHTLESVDLSDVQQTLNRNNLMNPGRTPEPGAIERFGVALIFALPLWFKRGTLGLAAAFLLSFLAPSAFFFLQNIITNRSIEAHHWVNPLIPLWCISLVLLIGEKHRRVVIPVVWSALLMTALFLQTASYFAWERLCKREPELYALDADIPQTLVWLNRETPPDSVVLANPNVMSALPLFTRNKVYWTDPAAVHVVADAEVIERRALADHWPYPLDRPLPYQADYYLGTQGDCPSSPLRRVLYRNKVERTCVVALHWALH